MKCPHYSLKCLVRRTNKLRKMLGHGRGHVEYKRLANSLGFNVKETVNFATTRFFSSAYEQWDMIFKSYTTLIDAYERFRQSDDEKDETKYDIRGQDFVIDLCGALDLFRLRFCPLNSKSK